MGQLEVRAALLKRARIRAGLTQQQLADLAELSVRTVRALESGSVSTPHVGSLTRIVAALGLASAARLDFLGAWGCEDHGEFAVMEALYAGDRPGLQGLRAAVRARVADLDCLALLSRAVVGENRRIQYRDIDMVVMARRDGVTGRVALCEPTSSVHLDLVNVDNSDACRVQRERTLPNLGVKVFELDFGKTLARGDTHGFHYRVDYRRATNASDRSAADDKSMCADLAGDGFYRTVPLYSFQVQFDPGDVPRECVRVFRARPGAAIVDMGRVPMSDWASAQLTIQDARPGHHGLRWRW